MNSASSRAVRLERKCVFVCSRIKWQLFTVQFEVQELYFPFAQFHFLVRLLMFHIELLIVEVHDHDVEEVLRNISTKVKIREEKFSFFVITRCSTSSLYFSNETVSGTDEFIGFNSFSSDNFPVNSLFSSF